MIKNKVIRFRITPAELYLIQQASGDQSPGEFSRKIILSQAQTKQTEFEVKRKRYNERISELNVIIADAQAEHSIIEGLLLKNADEERKTFKKQRSELNG
jgi:hypothetical protein